MNACRFLLPGMALGAAAILLVPGEESAAFSKIGGALTTSQRDFRVFDNFADLSANNNTSPHPTYPGFTGAEMAIWKGYVEWGSGPHGDGLGDPTLQGNIGDGGANFDPAWAGLTFGVGGADDNIASAITSCGGGGTLAYTETPISNGWRIRFCDEWVWADGPGTINPSSFDIQETACHEFGHALGLGHSTNGQATMAPVTSSGSLGGRSIHLDDVQGLKCIYGPAQSTKPLICETQISGTTLEIIGVNFAAAGNEVWFTNASLTSTGADPLVRLLNVSSTAGGTRISVTIPAGAGPGDVLARIPGGTTGEFLSNAFPFDPATTGFSSGMACGPFNVALVDPTTVPALVPGTGQFLTATGNGLDQTTSIDLNTTPIPPAQWTVVDPSTITIDLPQAPALGSQTLVFHHAGGSQSLGITVVAPTTPVLQLGTGDPQNVLTQAGGVDVIVSGENGEEHWLYYSLSSAPSNARKLCLAMGNGFTDLYYLVRYTVPPSGWFQTNEVYQYGGPPVVLYVQSIDLFSGANPKFGVSNLQSVTVTQ